MKPEPSPQPSAPGVVRFYSFLPRGERLLEDVLAGLALPQKSIPPKYFYDEQGCRLFEAICELPEYYLTRTETAILRGNIVEITQFCPPLPLPQYRRHLRRPYAAPRVARVCRRTDPQESGVFPRLHHRQLHSR